MNAETSGLPSIEGFKIIELLGKGGMAVVYTAEQLTLNRQVAIKVLPRDQLDESCIKRFQAEAKKLATLDHPGIVKVFACGITREGNPYLAMELLKGQSLADAISSKGSLSRDQLNSIFADLLAALQYAHEQGLIHRDIKPANVMIIEQQGKLSAKLLDFGIAKSLIQTEQRLTSTGDLVGTPAYMSPEQCNGKELSIRSDLYSLTCIIYECYMGEPPYDSENALERMLQHVSSPLPEFNKIKKRCGNELAKLIYKNLAKDPDERSSSAAEMLAELEEALHTVPEGDGEEGEKSKAKHPIVVVIVLFLIALSFLPFAELLPLPVQNAGQKPALSGKTIEAVEPIETAAPLAVDPATPILRRALNLIRQGMPYRYSDPEQAAKYFGQVDQLCVDANNSMDKITSPYGWYCNALKAVLEDEQIYNNRMNRKRDNEVLVAQAKAEWEAAVTRFPKFKESKAYGLCILGYVRGLNHVKDYAKAEELFEEDLARFYKMDPLPPATFFLQRAKCETNVGKDDIKQALKELKILAQVSTQLPCTEAAVFYNLLLQARISKPEDRIPILIEGLNLQSTFKTVKDKLAPEKQPPIKTLVPGSIETLEALSFPSWNMEERQVICHYHLALAYNKLKKLTKAKEEIELMEEIMEKSNVGCYDSHFDQSMVNKIKRARS